MSEQSAIYEDQNLLRKVDAEFEKSELNILLSRKVSFRHYSNLLVVLYYIIVFLFAGYLLSFISKALPSMSGQSEGTQLAVSISITAAFIALAGFGLNIQNYAKPAGGYDMLVEYNFKMLKVGVSEDKLALLKGLIIVKSKHPDISLQQVIHAPISSDKLLEILLHG